jgi:peptidoglycan/xylan/chitin deacetylase (PgdA/CDA1 family)
MKKRIPLALTFVLFLIFSLSGFSFHNITLSDDDRLLFMADFEQQRTLFVARLADLSMQQLTAFPENLEVVDNGRTILALSRFGTVRIPVSGGLPSVTPGFPSFAGGRTPLKGRAEMYAASSNGRWILYVEPISPAYGNLLLIEVSSGTKRVISEKVALPSLDFPARWSPDSRVFVYSKNGRLFYFPIMQDMSAVINERFRQIGPGAITSVHWGQHGDFYYFTGNTLYRVPNPELFTRTIYGDFLSIGNVTAVFPFEFDSGFDRFWIAPNSGSILINKMGKSLFLIPLGDTQYSSSIFPHVKIPQGACNISVLWPSTGSLETGTLTIISQAQSETAVWRFEINGRFVTPSIAENIPPASGGILSPDGTKALFWGENGGELWDYANWRLIQKFGDGPVFSCAWLNNRSFISGDSRFIEEVNISGPSFTRRRICLSGADEFGFEENSRTSSRIVARTGTEWFASDGRSSWTPATNPQLRNISLSSERFRVFLENQPSGLFENIPMIRNLASVGTVSLVSSHSPSSAYTLAQPPEQRTSGQRMTGRTTQGRISIALCFDLYNDDTGLAQVLNALNRFNIKATFFMNGDFIRRNPLAAEAIAKSGHETASLFYAPIDLSDTRYVVNAQFIAQGLARNEDEFYRATGRELSLLWHPPFHRSSPEINSAAAAAGYTTVLRDVDPGDWLTKEDALRLGLSNIGASEIIENIIRNKKHGAVIPVRLGLMPGGRDEYLYQHIEVLLDALIRSGCEIVPVSAVAR